MARILLILLLLSGLGVAAQPSLKGGLDKFVQSNKVYPLYSLQNCIQGTVRVSFKLNAKGNVYFSAVEKGIGTDLDDEALRLIRLSSGKWNVPAGHDTTISVVVPINFKLDDQNCANKSKADIRLAIQAYENHAGLTNAVLNFYRNKASGTFTPAEEARIVTLKESLGYNEEYLNTKLNEGRKKLKQKDRQGACEDFLFVKHMGSDKADELLAANCN
ncbi:MAG: energy transducer TonB [Pedobacter sp.]|nr:MAG: energy transducer TonB [Pedobacter sp.]